MNILTILSDNDEIIFNRGNHGPQFEIVYNRVTLDHGLY